MYLSSGAVMDGLVFSAWQVDANPSQAQPRRGGFAKQAGGKTRLSMQLFNMRGGAAGVGSSPHLLPLSHHALW